MRVLHLFSNFKWTGPADPAVSLASSLKRAGVDVVLRSSGYLKGGSINHIAERARELGIEPVLDLSLGKHRSMMRDRPDVVRLAQIFARGVFDLVHTHLPNDFRIAVRARDASGVKDLPIVRSLYDTDPDALDTREVERLRVEAQHVLVFSQRVHECLIERGFDPERVQLLAPIVDLERFDPSRPVEDMRPSMGIGAGDFVAGIVARVQPQRRFDLLLDVAERVARQIDGFRIVVIGRGSHIDEVARDPARERGLLDRVIVFPGYQSGDAYPAMLRALDLKLFLVPGTDGTARAVREALASGLPVVATPRGMLPELVRDGETGFVVEETADAFSDAIVRLHGDPPARAAMGATARRDAVARFDPAQQTEAVRRLYDTLHASSRAT